MSENENLDIHRLKVHEIRGQVPGRIVIWGLPLVCIVFNPNNKT